MANADSPTNLMGRLQNTYAKANTPAEEEDESENEASFTEITLDVVHPKT